MTTHAFRNEKNSVWIVNYNAAPPHLATMFRHICFAREMSRAGYDVRIICASSIHNTDIQIETGPNGYKEVEYDGIKFVHINTRPYGSSNRKRIIEHVRFPHGLRNLSKILEPPAVVLHAAAVPFDIPIARLVRRLGAKYIVEIADLWPASFLAFGLIRPGNPMLPLAYAAEHWLYHVADELVFTMEGGEKYVREKGWHSARRWPVNLEKIHHINQGVDLAAFDAGTANLKLDSDLDDLTTFKVVYVGSIRRANNLTVILDAAERIGRTDSKRIQFLIYGDGDHRAELEQQVEERRIRNVKFKGRIPPADVPATLVRSDLNLFHFSPTDLTRFGLSPNKLFIYFASGIPVLSTLRPAYDLVERYQAGVSVNGSPDEIAEGVLRIANANKSQYSAYGVSARHAATDFDYSVNAQKLISLLPPI